MPWLSVKMSLAAASAEDFSDALLVAGAQSTTIDAPESAMPTVSALLPAHADAREVIAAAATLCRLTSAPTFELTALGDEDWVRRTQAQFAPLQTGRLWIGPTWLEAPPGATVHVHLDPGLAFGTGSHPTTRLMLNYIERELRAADRVLDYGCGSGILAIAAAKLGAARVDAVDIDAQALAVARANAAHNAVKIGTWPSEDVPAGSYDLVVSNILAQPLIVLAPLLAARTVAGGRIALSGILTSQAAEVAEAYRPWFAMDVQAHEDAWALLGGTRT
jgi:ribosomal protein L11 methyltransferase